MWGVMVQVVPWVRCHCVGQDFGLEMALEQAMKTQGRLGLEQHCPMGVWPCTALSHRGCWFTQSSSNSPLGPDLLWSRVNQFPGCSLLQ